MSPCAHRGAGRVVAKKVKLALPSVGHAGMVKLRYVGDKLGKPLRGDETNAHYPFNRKTVLFVDIRDAAMLLGPEFEILE